MATVQDNIAIVPIGEEPPPAPVPNQENTPTEPVAAPKPKARAKAKPRAKKEVIVEVPPPPPPPPLERQETETRAEATSEAPPPRKRTTTRKRVSTKQSENNRRGGRSDFTHARCSRRAGVIWHHPKHGTNRRVPPKSETAQGPQETVQAATAHRRGILIYLAFFIICAYIIKHAPKR